MPTWLIQNETQIYNWLGFISVLKIKYNARNVDTSEMFLLVFQGKNWTM